MAASRTTDMLTESKLAAIKKPEDGKAYKVADRDGLYVYISPSGGKAFRLDYRVNGRRETLTIGRHVYRAGQPARELAELAYGMEISLAEARLLLARAKRQVEQGESPSRAKVEGRAKAATATTFDGWAQAYFKFKSDPKSGDECLADSTLAMRKSVYQRTLAGPLGRLKLAEVTAALVRNLCDQIKVQRGPAPAVQARELVLLIFRHAIGKGEQVTNPADSIAPRSIATFKARDRALTPAEIRTFFNALESTPTTPTLRLAVRFMLLTMVRKSEFIDATWPEIDFGSETWVIPAARMKAARPHVVPLSQQALDILVAFKACFSTSRYLHAGRYESDVPISNATLNRVIDATVKRINAKLPDGAEEFESFSVHDLRRTASTLLHEAGFNLDWIEKSLAHERTDVRATYNKAQYLEQRRLMLQAWADMIDAWVKGHSAREIIQRSRVAAASATLEIEAGMLV
jgi:integrase